MGNVMFGPMNRKARGSDVQQRARALLAKLGLEGFEAKYPNQLSGGMQRRAELARALINSPKVMLLDEPFRGLDAMTRELMQVYLLRVFEDEPVTTIFVTTEIEEAILLADQIILLTNTPAAVKQVIDVVLPRPRNLKMLSSASFGEIQGAVLESLLEEARKAFSEGMHGAARPNWSRPMARQRAGKPEVTTRSTWTPRDAEKSGDCVNKLTAMPQPSGRRYPHACRPF